MPCLPNQSEVEDVVWGCGEWDRNKILRAKSLAWTLILLSGFRVSESLGAWGDGSQSQGRGRWSILI